MPVWFWYLPKFAKCFIFCFQSSSEFVFGLPENVLVNEYFAYFCSLKEILVENDPFLKNPGEIWNFPFKNFDCFIIKYCLYKNALPFNLKIRESKNESKTDIRSNRTTNGVQQLSPKHRRQDQIPLNQAQDSQHPKTFTILNPQFVRKFPNRAISPIPNKPHQQQPQLRPFFASAKKKKKRVFQRNDEHPQTSPPRFSQKTSRREQNRNFETSQIHNIRTFPKLP